MRPFFILLAAPALLAQNSPPPIAGYLALTPGQTAEMAQNLLDYSEYRDRTGERTFLVWQEIAEQRRREPIAPLALGLRFAELVTIKRETAERERAVTARQLTILTPEQTIRPQNLIEADRLSNQLAPEARGLFLMPTRFGLQPFPDLSLLPANAPPAPTRKPSARRTAEDPTSLERFFELTPEQIARYRANQAGRLQQRSGSGERNRRLERQLQRHVRVSPEPAPDRFGRRACLPGLAPGSRAGPRLGGREPGPLDAAAAAAAPPPRTGFGVVARRLDGGGAGISRVRRWSRPVPLHAGGHARKWLSADGAPPLHRTLLPRTRQPRVHRRTAPVNAPPREERASAANRRTPVV